ncbi:MAG: hypothetical protein IID44_03405 [Planctomycetes bacterium]|nr:hypothetical protein [Planctomycetota bacterium]
MSVTKDDIQDVNRFVDEKLVNGGAESLRQLVTEWEERQEVNAAIRQGIADIDADRTEPFFESQDRFRQERGLPPRK